MANVHFENNSIQVMAAIEQASIAALYEAANELTSQVKRNTSVGKVGGGDTKNSWQNDVDESKLEAIVGNPLENALWEEFGTGEWAAEGNGRKGGWYIPIGNGEGEISEQVVAAYNFKVVYGKDGKKYAYTTGKKPKHTLQNTYERNKNKIKRMIQDKLKGL